MPIEWKVHEGNLVEYSVSGELKLREYQKFQAELESLIEKKGKIKMLALLRNFAGWEPGNGWEDTSFYDRNDAHIEKFAIVGNEAWRDLVTVFLLKDMRPVPIEFFTPEQEQAARQWLDGD